MCLCRATYAVNSRSLLSFLLTVWHLRSKGERQVCRHQQLGLLGCCFDTTSSRLIMQYELHETEYGASCWKMLIAWYLKMQTSKPAFYCWPPKNLNCISSCLFTCFFCPVCEVMFTPNEGFSGTWMKCFQFVERSVERSVEPSVDFRCPWNNGQMSESKDGSSTVVLVLNVQTLKAQLEPVCYLLPRQKLFGLSAEW